MDFEAFFYLYLMAVGFALAGVTMTVFHLATGKPLGFAFGRIGNAALAPVAIAVRFIAGPGILVRNAFTSGMSLNSDPVWLVVGLAMAGAWALTSGALLMTSIGPLAAMN